MSEPPQPPRTGPLEARHRVMLWYTILAIALGLTIAGIGFWAIR